RRSEPGALGTRATHVGDLLDPQRLVIEPASAEIRDMRRMVYARRVVDAREQEVEIWVHADSSNARRQSSHRDKRTDQDQLLAASASAIRQMPTSSVSASRGSSRAKPTIDSGLSSPGI